MYVLTAAFLQYIQHTPVALAQIQFCQSDCLIKVAMHGIDWMVKVVVVVVVVTVDTKK